MLYKNKRDWILKFIQDRKVLDLGCVNNSLETEGPNWLHGFIASHAKSVLGVDILQKEIETLKRQGYNVVCQDVQALALDDKFEVIVAGDIIEHLSNPGIFLERVRVHLAPGGLFLVTTPNPLTSIRFFQMIFMGVVDANAEHTCWFSPKVFTEITRRSGLQIIETTYVDDTYQYYRGANRLWGPFLLMQYLTCRIRPQFAETLCFALQLAK